MCYKCIPFCGEDKQLGIPVKKWLYYSVFIYAVFLAIHMIAMVYCLASRDFAINMSLLNVGLEIFNVFFTFYFLHYEYWKKGVKVNGTNVSGGNFTDLFLIYLIFEVIYFILIDGFRYMPDSFNEVVDRTATKNLYLCLYDFHLEYFDHFIHIIMFIMYIWMWFALNIKLKHG